MTEKLAKKGFAVKKRFSCFAHVEAALDKGLPSFMVVLHAIVRVARSLSNKNSWFT